MRMEREKQESEKGREEEKGRGEEKERRRGVKGTARLPTMRLILYE